MLTAVVAGIAPACTDYKILPHDAGYDGAPGTGGATGVTVGTGGNDGGGAVGAGTGGADGGLPDLARVDGGPDGVDAPVVMGTMLTISPDAQSFGTVIQNRGVSSQTFTVSNGGQQATAAATVALGGVDRAEFQVTADGCTGQSIPANGSCQITVRFAPTGTGARSASLTVSAGTGVLVVAQLTGSGITLGTLTITPETRDFGSVQQMMAGATQAFTVKNTGQATTSALATALVGGDNSNFSIAANTCDGHTLAAAVSCVVTVQFAPVTPGSKLVTLSVTGGAGEVGVAQLSGTSLPTPFLAITPMSKDFNAVTVNQTASATFLVTNPGGGATGLPAVTVTGAAPSDTGQFSIPAGSNGCGAALAAGASCSITVRFAPTSTGSKNGTLTVSASPGTSVTATLTGTAIAAGKLGISPLSQDFGSLLQGTTGATAVTFSATNSGASATGTLQAQIVGSSEFKITQDRCSQTVLAPQASCTVDVVFAPTTASPSGSLQILATNPADSASAGLGGVGLAPAKLTISPTASTFGDTVAGQTGASPISFTVRNSGGVAAGTAAGLTPALSGTNQADFSVVTAMSTCAGALAAGAQCTVVVAFNPRTTGSNKTASLTVNATPGGPAVASVGGNGITAAALALAPAASNMAAFGNVVVGVPRDQTFVVTNTGQQASTGLQITFANPAGAGFSLLTGAADDCAANVAVAGSGRCNLRVHFAPAGRGAQTATLAVSAAVGDAPAGLTLTGTGQVPVGLTANPASVALGNVTVGVATPTSVVINNGGDLATSVPTLTNGNPTELTITSGCTAAIPALGSCTLALSFKPSAGGARSAIVTVAVSGASVMFTVGATGIVPCGAVGQPCCTGAGVAACGQNLTCAAATATCACGGSGQPCCGGAGGTCTGAGTVCGTSATCGPPTGNGIACQTSPQCASNNCTGAICCAAGQSGCTGSCVNLTSDNANCGACGKTCVLGKETCVASACRLNDGQSCSAGSQCVSGVCPQFFVDSDGDHFGTSVQSGFCSITTPPVGFATVSGDCCDSNSGINPGINAFQALAAPACPGGTMVSAWDWNCSRAIEANITNVSGCSGMPPTCSNIIAPFPDSSCGDPNVFPKTCISVNTGPGGFVCEAVQNGATAAQQLQQGQGGLGVLGCM